MSTLLACIVLAIPAVAAVVWAQSAPRLAFQVFAVRDLCEKDFVGTLKAVRATCYDGERVEFHDVWGKRIAPVKIGPKTWRVHTGESPVYFTGARIKL